MPILHFSPEEAKPKALIESTKREAMSRREGRDSDSKRHLSSRLDRDRSPKRTRRDGKPEAGRLPRNAGTDVSGHTDRDQRHRHRKQDALAVEATSVPDSKAETASVNKEFAMKPNGHHQGDNSKATYLQHDERGNARQVGRSSSRKSSNERGWRDSRDWLNEREANKSAGHDTHPRDGKPEAKEDGKNVWRHDRFQEREADPVPPSRKRPAFREKKIVDPEPSDKAPMEPVITNRSDHSTFGSEKLEERDHKTQHLDKREKSYGGDRVSSRGEAPRGGFPPRERYAGGGGNYGGRDRYGGRQGYHPSGGRVEKWKHDLFHEANRSPTPKNEEDQIAKVEALLAS